MVRKPRLSANQKFAIVRAHEKGASAQSLAKEYGVSARAIYYTLRSDQARRKDSHVLTKQISVRLTESELARFDALVVRHKIGKRTDAMRRLIQIADDLFVPDDETGDALHGVSASLNRIGNNVSQIAKRMNEANVKGMRPPFPDRSYQQMRSLAGFVFDMGDQVQQMVERRRAGLSVRINAAMKDLADAQD